MRRVFDESLHEIRRQLCHLVLRRLGFASIAALDVATTSCDHRLRGYGVMLLYHGGKSLSTKHAAGHLGLIIRKFSFILKTQRCDKENVRCKKLLYASQRFLSTYLFVFNGYQLRAAVAHVRVHRYLVRVLEKMYNNVATITP